MLHGSDGSTDYESDTDWLADLRRCENRPLTWAFGSHPVTLRPAVTKGPADFSRTRRPNRPAGLRVAAFRGPPRTLESVLRRLLSLKRYTCNHRKCGARGGYD